MTISLLVILIIGILGVCAGSMAMISAIFYQRAKANLASEGLDTVATGKILEFCENKTEGRNDINITARAEFLAEDGEDYVVENLYCDHTMELYGEIELAYNKDNPKNAKAIKGETGIHMSMLKSSLIFLGVLIGIEMILIITLAIA